MVILNRAVYTRESKPRITQSSACVSRELSHLYDHGLYKNLVRGLRKPRTSFSCCLYEQSAAYKSRGLCNPRLIFPRINRPNVSCSFTTRCSVQLLLPVLSCGFSLCSPGFALAAESPAAGPAVVFWAEQRRRLHGSAPVGRSRAAGVSTGSSRVLLLWHCYSRATDRILILFLSLPSSKTVFSQPS